MTITLEQEVASHLSTASNVPRFRVSSVGLFGDLCWAATPQELADIRTADPAVLYETDSRWFALQRHPDGIRFYAGPAPEMPATREYELGYVDSVGDAAEFLIQWLSGTPLHRVSVSWRPAPF